MHTWSWHLISRLDVGLAQRGGLRPSPQCLQFIEGGAYLKVACGPQSSHVIGLQPLHPLLHILAKSRLIHTLSIRSIYTEQQFKIFGKFQEPTKHTCPPFRQNNTENKIRGYPLVLPRLEEYLDLVSHPDIRCEAGHHGVWSCWPY